MPWPSYCSLFFSFIYAFIGWSLYVPWPRIKLTTLVYWYDALTNWATQPGHHGPFYFHYITLHYVCKCLFIILFILPLENKVEKGKYLLRYIRTVTKSFLSPIFMFPTGQGQALFSSLKVYFSVINFEDAWKPSLQAKLNCKMQDTMRNNVLGFW